MKAFIHKNFQEITGASIGGATPWVKSFFENTIWHDWGQPIVLSAICAFVGFIVTKWCKKLFKEK